MVIKNYCDYCGKEFKMDKLIELKVTYKQIEKPSIRKDICEGCLNKLNLKNYMPW